MIEKTEPLINGSEIPAYPSTTTSRKIVQLLGVYDAEDGKQLQGGQLGGTELSMLMSGDQMALRHLYLFTVRNNHLYHTRPLAIIQCETADADPE